MLLSPQLVYGLILIAASCLSWQGWLASQGRHPNHFSSAEVRWNESTGNFEVALCIWPVDLEKAIGIFHDKKINLDTDPELDQHIAGYLAKKFTIEKVAADAPLTTEDDLPVKGPDAEPGTRLGTDHHAKPIPVPAGVSDDQTEPTPSVGVADNTTTDNTTTGKVTPTPEPTGNSLSPTINRSYADEHAAAVKPTDVDNRLRYVGHELGIKEGWLYFEIKGDSEIGRWELQNRIFFEFNADQVNQVRLTLGNKVRSFGLRPEQHRLVFETAKKKGPPGLQIK